MKASRQASRVLVVASMCLAVAASARGETILAQYNLGEAGSIDSSGNLIDSVGGHTIGIYIGVPVVDVTGGAPGSTKALSFPGVPTLGGYIGADTAMPTDNFRVEIWAKTPAANINQECLFFFGGDGTDMYGTGSLAIGMHAGNWLAMYSGVAFIGGLGQPAVADTWAKLAVERVNGTSTFYVNGIATPGTTDVTPVSNKTVYLGVQPGGVAWFTGSLDQLTVSQVPEPAALTLLGSGLLGLLAYAWRKRK